MHIGPLIGSKTDKGPCQKNSTHLHDTTAAALNQIQVKTENPSKSGKLDVMVKPEIVDTHTQYDIIDGGGGVGGVLNHKNIDTINRSYEKIALVPHHPPNYTLNPKLLEQPEMSISPARGSIGPGIPKIQAGATQPIDILIENEKPTVNTMNNLLAQNQTPVPNRRARVGKNMAREMMLQSRSNITDSAHETELNMQGNEPANQMKSDLCTSTPIKEQIHHDEYETNELSTLPHFLSASSPINGKLIKQEDVKKECDDDILMISDKSETETISSDTDKSQNGIQIIDLSCENGVRNHCMDDEVDDDDDDSHFGQSRKRRIDSGSSPSEIIDVDEDVTVTAVKRRKIMEFHKNPSKKSPPNSYKSLIKPSETKSYLCRAENVSPKDKDQPTSKSNATHVSDEVSFVAQKSMSNGIHELHDSHTGNARDMDATESNKIECSEYRNEIHGKSLDTISLTPSIADEFPQELSAEEENFMSHLDSNCEGISKGYCSDNELLSRKKERLKNKLQKCEGRSRSESKKSDKMSQATATSKSNKATKPKSRKTSRDRSTSSNKSKERSERPASKKPKLSETVAVNSIAVSNTTSVITPKKKADGKAKKEKSKVNKSCDNKSKKTTPPPVDGRPMENDCNVEMNTEADDELLDNESHHNNNNNNNCILFDKNNKMSLDALVATSQNRTATSNAKKSKSRGSKFSNKKRHRQRSSKHIEEVFVPRQTLAQPRWSNGWNWQGEPFQGKVFLNVSV